MKERQQQVFWAFRRILPSWSSGFSCCWAWSDGYARHTLD